MEQSSAFFLLQTGLNQQYWINISIHPIAFQLKSSVLRMGKNINVSTPQSCSCSCLSLCIFPYWPVFSLSITFILCHSWRLILTEHNIITTVRMLFLHRMYNVSILLMRYLNLSGEPDPASYGGGIWSEDSAYYWWSDKMGNDCWIIRLDEKEKIIF